MGVTPKSNRSRIRHLTIILASLVAFSAAWVTQTDTKLKQTQTAPNETAVRREFSLPSLPAPLDSETAYQAILQTNEEGDSFQTHFLSLSLTQKLEDHQLAEVLRSIKSLQGDDAGIVAIIFALDLGYRNPDALVALLDNPSFLENNPLQVRNLFRYWAASSPDKAFAIACLLDGRAREDALAGVSMSGQPGMADRVRAYQKSPDYAAGGKRVERQKAIQAVKEKTWRTDRDTFLRTFISAFNDSPQFGMEHALQIDDQGIRYQAINQLLRARWPNPEDAINTVIKLSDEKFVLNPQTRYQYFGQALQAADSETLPAALDLLTRSLTPAERSNVLSNIQLSFSGANLEIIKSDFFRSIPDSPKKSQFLQNAFSNLAQTDWQTALDLANRELSPRLLESALPSLIPHAYKGDGPEAAIDLISTISNPPARYQSITQLVHTWGREDPLSFLTWIIAQPTEDIQPQFIQAASNYWAGEDLASLMEFESHNPMGPTKISMQESIGQRLANTDPIQAIEFASTIGDIERANSVINLATIMWARNEPRQAADFLVSTLPEEAQTPPTLTQIARTWSQFDAPAAAHYFNSLENEIAANSGLGVAIDRWATLDPQATLEFLKTIPAGPRRDRVVSTGYGSFTRYAIEQPELAHQMIELIDDPQSRASAEKEFTRQNPTFDL